jgi:RHS repeat-associated protein
MNHRKYLTILLTAIGIQFCKLTEAQTINYTQNDVVLTSGAKTDAQVNSLGIGSVQTTRIYIDGLGRPIQNVALQASPNSNKDIIQVAAYSSIGQQPITYLPYVDNTGNYTTGSYRTTGLTDQGTYYANSSGNTNKVAGDTYPYSQKVFENSPLRRLLQEGDVGNGFQPGQHYKSYNYRSNNSTDNVLMWNSSGVYQNQSYPVNSLSVTSATKEDGVAMTIVFTDNLGHMILKREVLSSTKNLDTYYIYNDAGKIAFVVPPKAVALMIQNNNYSLTQTGVVNLVFSFLYDNLDRLYQKNIPGSAPIYYIYDAYNRMVLVQDGNKRTSNQWYYIKYDVKDRPISQGIYTDNTTGRTGGVSGGMQSYVNGLSTAKYESRVGNTASYYTNSSFPTANSDNSAVQDLIYTYYDDYYLTQGANPDFQYAYQSLQGEAANNAATTLTRGLLTMIRKRTVGSGLNNIWLINVFFYDGKGNAIQTQSNNHLGSATGGNIATDYKTNVVDFVGKPLVSLTKKAAGAAGSVSVKTILTYDSHNIRLLYVDQVYNTQSSIRIASYEYNELGQLVKKNLQPINPVGSNLPTDITESSSNSVTSGTTTTVVATHSITFSPGFNIASGATYNAYISSGALQSVDYRYNIRGQVTSINNSTLTNDGITNGDANDLFGMQIMYDQPDVALNSSTNTATPSYMGKISAIKWMTVDNNFLKTNERSYVYTYDETGRLTAANYAERAAGSASNTVFDTNKNGFDEAGIVYDENGNIANLNRNSSTIGANSYTQVDQLAYTYDATNPNQLKTVSDANNSTSTQYTGYGFRNITGTTNGYYSYDPNGNLKADPYKGITIGYNILNKTDNIQVTTGANGVSITGKYINYTYDAAGTVIRKQQYDNSGQLITVTDYIDGFVYVNNSLSYFPMGEGRVLNSGGTLKPEYIIADQQGNARFSFQDGGNGTVKIIQENSYYAFGLAFANSPITMPTVPNKQLYNGGSEWQNDYSNLPDYYQALNRNYDAGLGRFIAVDPMAETSISLSTYHYAYNDPLTYNDPTGNDGEGDGTWAAGPLEYFFGYSGYNSQAESKGSSTAGTDQAGTTDGSDKSKFHYDYSYNAYGEVVARTQIPGAGPDTWSFVTVKSVTWMGTDGSILVTYTNDPNNTGVGDENAVAQANSNDNSGGIREIMGGGAGAGSGGDEGDIDYSHTVKGITLTFISGAIANDPATNTGSGSFVSGYATLPSTFIKNNIENTPTILNNLKGEAIGTAELAGKLNIGIGVMSSVLTGYESVADHGRITWGDAVKIGIGLAATFTPYGWVYTALDVTVAITSGKSLTDRIGSGIDNVRDKW